MNKNVRVIYKKIEPQFLNKYGYINLNHRNINSKNDLIEIASIFRNPMYETFRIIYMKDNKIVGHEAITTKTSNHVYIFKQSKKGKQNAEKCFYKIKNRMERLNANSYYMVHNHPSGNAKSSTADMHLTEYFYKKISGFKGHLIINLDSYAWIDINKYGTAITNNYLQIKNLKKDRLYKMMKCKSIYDIQITCRDDLVYLMHHIKNSPDYSTAILTDCMGKIRMILDLPNRFLNMPTNQLNGYFNNLANLNGVTRIFFATSENDVYKKSLKHLDYGTFTDSICYKSENDKIYVYEKLNIVESNNLKSEITIDNNLLSVNEEEIKYDNFSELDILSVPKGRIRILFKAVGQPAKIVTIPNTLEAKQKLVGGLIEVIQYDDVLLVCNDEGKLLNLPPNLVFESDYIAGNCFIIGDDYENGDFKSLTLDEIEKYKKDIDSKSMKYIKPEEMENLTKEKQKEKTFHRK